MRLVSRRLDDWRSFFGNSDIFDVIENGILIAASDCPAEFHKRRAQIAEMLFSCRTSRCDSCNHVELQVPEQEDEDEEFRREVECAVSDEGGGKETKANSSTGDVAGMVQGVSNCSYDEAEALTEEIEEESQTIGEVFRIKAILANKIDESDSVLFESLRRLQLMELSVETLRVTEIGKAVNGLRKHNSKKICQLVRTLIEGWKVLVDEWVAAAPALEESTPESANPSSYDPDTDKGLPSPPLDEGAFLATQTTSIEFSKFFEGMDDDGNPRAFGEFNKNKVIERRPTLYNKNNLTTDPLSYPSTLSKEKASIRTQDTSIKENWLHEAHDKQGKIKKSNIRSNVPQDSFYKPQKLKDSNTRSFASRPETNPNLGNSYKFNEMKPQRKLVHAEAQKRSARASQDKLRNSDDNSVRAKIEVAKRKLQERYQEADNAKKQRTIQVMELNDLPRQTQNRRPFPPKRRNFTRHWSNRSR